VINKYGIRLPVNIVLHAGPSLQWDCNLLQIDKHIYVCSQLCMHAVCTHCMIHLLHILVLRVECVLQLKTRKLRLL